MQYGGDDGADAGALSRTAYREAEKKYQLFRERKIKMKHGKPKPGKLVIRPIDMSDVLDFHLNPEGLLPPEVLCHEVPGYDGAVYTFTRHPGLVYMPGALPGPQQLELIGAALMDYPEPPAHTNHDLQYGPLTGLWRAARQGLRLNRGRQDDPLAAAAGTPCQRRGPGGCAAETEAAVAVAVAAAGEPVKCFEGGPGTVATPPLRTPSVSEPKGSCGDHDCDSIQREDVENDGEIGCSSSSSGSTRRGSRAGGGRSHRNSGSGSDCCGDAAEAEASAPASFEECWSTNGPGPPAVKLLQKLRWSTLGPQFNWTQRQYDFRSVYRRLPPSLESLAKQLAAVVDALEVAGLRVMPPAAASGGYQPDAAIINYYQQGDVLGGHLDDVERDMAQPIVSVSLGCPAIFLMGGPTKHMPPSALLLRGGDVLVLAGEARTCYHGVPRILEANYPGGGGGGGAVGSKGAQRDLDGMDGIRDYIRNARINISIRAVS